MRGRLTLTPNPYSNPSPSLNQVLKLREELQDEREAAAAAGGGLLEVGTVDGFQGPLSPLYLPDTFAISPVYLPRWARWTGSRGGRRRRSSSRWCAPTRGAVWASCARRGA